MAGRPKKMANSVGPLEVRAFELTDAIYQIAPEQYLEDAKPSDPMGMAWRQVIEAAIHLWTCIGDLGDELRQKAGIEGDGPTDHCRLARRSPGELLRDAQEPSGCRPVKAD
jgi:hypothetical protein